MVAPCCCANQRWRMLVQRLVLSTCFNNFIISVLVVNAIVLAVGEHYISILLMIICVTQ